jgi:uncharacterized membrane protein YkvA (DUF1232 family)
MEIHESNYSDESFWKKVKKHALRAGREVIEDALVLYYALQDEETPKWAKTVIIGALAYFILPTDAIPDVIPVAGFTDDLGALAAALTTVGMHLKKDHFAKAQNSLDSFFGKDRIGPD